MEYKNGNLIVKTLEDLEEAIKVGSLCVSAICPKCNEDWTSLIPNAKYILGKGCLGCIDEDEDDEWTPKIGVF